MIDYLKTKYYWFNINRKLKKFLNNNDESKILLFGFPKSGNTWLRFLLFNYRCLLLDINKSATLTYDELNELQNNTLEKGTSYNEQEGFPVFYRTHDIYNCTYDLFDKRIFIHRNPLDTLISAYYFYKNREVPFWDDPENMRKDLEDIDFYVRYKLDSWIKFYNTSIKHADIVMNYSAMKQNCEKELLRLIQFLGWKEEENLIKKAVELSSFERVDNMGKENDQAYGNGPKDGTFLGNFTRSGQEGQFKSELKEETINFVLDKFPEFKKVYSPYLDS